MTPPVPQKMIDQMTAAGLPSTGRFPFIPKITKNRAGEEIIEKRAVTKGPKRGKRGYVDDQGRIWIKDRAHAHVPDHWDLQLDGGVDYLRVDLHGNEIL